VQLGRAVECLLGLRLLGRRSTHVGCVFDARQVVQIGGAVLRQRAGVRRALLIDVVLQLLAIDLDERLSRGDAITEIGEYATNNAVDLGRDRDLVFGGQRANHLEDASNRLLTNRFGLDAPGGLFRSAVLLRTRVRAAGGDGRHGTQHDQYEGNPGHKP
jgi:hypothetical protein